MKSLLRNGFINKSSERILISHDVYLDDRFLDDYPVELRDLRTLKEVMSQKLKDPENLFHLGTAFYFKRMSSDAVDCYRKSFGINPASYQACRSLGWIYAGEENFEEAMNGFEKP